ncbi:MAG: hypothetical protein K6A79_06495 [Ruminococcus sp.]|nr:hypothetical protein [Ruminococcus sp.]
MEYPIRKDIRLNGFDYSRNGAYFVTVCTKDKMCIFWENGKKYQPLTDTLKTVGAHSVRPPMQHRIHLSEYGMAAKNSFKIVSAHYPMVFFDKYVIMPNHIHAIIRIEASYVRDGRTECAPTLSQIIKNFKENATREIGFSVWQKSFYDRVIRNEHEYSAFWKYIETNPMNWESDELFTKE